MESKILTVGHCCIDNISYTNHYPLEDCKLGSGYTTPDNNSIRVKIVIKGGKDSLRSGKWGSDLNLEFFRCLDQFWARGGNASNNACVLSQLGIGVEYFGTLARGSLLSFIENDFKSDGICFENCVYYDNCQCPNSTVIISKANGSRTIVHSNKNLPELCVNDLKKLDVGKYAWIHFEGRNTAELREMLIYLRSFDESVRPRVSVEIEKYKPGMEDLFGLADLYFFSKDYAFLSGFSDMVTTVKHFAGRIPGTDIICAWGDLGAAAFDARENQVYTSPAEDLDAVVDTLGAGDTFNAGVISRLYKGDGLSEAIRFGCWLAGKKCEKVGLKCVKDIVKDREMEL